MEKYFQICKAGQVIQSKLTFDESVSVSKIIIFVNGFAGHKDGSSTRTFSGLVTKQCPGVAVLAFDLPGHGDDQKQSVYLEDCLTYIGLVADYCRTELTVDSIYAYATSFGGYLTLDYISKHGNPFVKVAFRCPAIPMASVLYDTIMSPEERDAINKGDTIPVGFDRKVNVNLSFLQDLRKEDISLLDYSPYADKLFIVHGTKDEIVPFDGSQRFSTKNNIRLLAVENADHRFTDPSCMELANSTILDFFAL